MTNLEILTLSISLILLLWVLIATDSKTVPRDLIDTQKPSPPVAGVYDEEDEA